ncbi:MAG TPA: cytochrome c oxidase subunit 3 family protein [Rhodothermales bacterium]|nr:cytochrome c oxidase subunit 3 family protein [Rhodothermales bacterium]
MAHPNPEDSHGDAAHGAHGDGHDDLYLVGHDGQLHPAYLQHHFVSAQQQFEASKLGMWLFLVTEILLFGGMFVAYSIYRAWYPSLFEDASLQLNTTLGALNTLVLLLSSLTVAWAIRGAQTDNRRVLFWNLIATVALAGTFMVVKYFEYEHKFHLGIFPGQSFEYAPGTTRVNGELVEGTRAVALLPAEEGAEHGAEGRDGGHEPTVGAVGQLQPAVPVESHDGRTEAIVLPPDDPGANLSPAEHVTGEGGTLGAEPHEAGEEHNEREGPIFSDPRAGVFFSIYYVMTGIHGLHVIIGMIAISILAYRSRKGVYSSVYYTPVENVGLYWHVVDIIWIFLFPLMYLI